jgi:DNA-binding transcriptional ArsR family regulator
MELFAVLADPIRLEIIEMLAKGDHTSGDIAAKFPVTGPAISRHLRVLRESGIAVYRQDAQSRIYSLNPEPLGTVADWTSRVTQLWRERFDALGQYLDKAHEKGHDDE